jgi:hypothetical protein
MLNLFLNFVAGALLCNSIPHLAAGLRGEMFPSPFASPPGVGNSRPVVNVIWGLCNVVGGIALLEYAPVAVGLNISFCSAVMGALLTGVGLGWHFGRVRGKYPHSYTDE